MQALRAFAKLGCVNAVLLAFPIGALASHIAVGLDTPALWVPLNGTAGYLDFTHPGPGAFGANEEYTGWVDTPGAPHAPPGVGTGATPDLAPGGLATFDNGLTHGDRVDFDFVAENRPIEVGVVIPPVGPNHGIVGPLEWGIGLTTASGHIDPATGLPHVHTGLLPDCTGDLIGDELCLPDYASAAFFAVDVFSVSATPVDAVGIPTDPAGLVSDAEVLPRDAVLDYDLFFCNGIAGCVAGVPTLVFAPGWSAAATADDFVARWTSPIAATHVIIDPVGAPAAPHDEVTQIDAIVAYVPEPSTALLLASGLAVLAVGRRRRAL
jgi:hypothetical protein